MKRRLPRLLLGLLVGLALLSSLLGLLIWTLGNNQSVYAGRAIGEWRQQLNSPEPGASNAAYAVLSARVIPQLVETMLHDRQDSRLRGWLVEQFNSLPGVQIVYFDAPTRRANAASLLGGLGPAAAAALPALLEVVQGNDTFVKGSAMLALGKIQAAPDKVVPLLAAYLEDQTWDVTAARALGEFGPRAKPAVPKLLPLLQAPDKDDRAAAREALLKIDPETAAKAIGPGSVRANGNAPKE